MDYDDAMVARRKFLLNRIMKKKLEEQLCSLFVLTPIPYDS